MMASRSVKFYQTGTFTVGNRLLTEDERSVQSDQHRANALNCGHRACQGCGEALGARYAIDAAMRAANGRLIVANATGCLEVFSTPYHGEFVADPMDALAFRECASRCDRHCSGDEG
jgi:pyruvate ferredoxin oxidoreductase beta subunit